MMQFSYNDLDFFLKFWIFHLSITFPQNIQQHSKGLWSYRCATDISIQWLHIPVVAFEEKILTPYISFSAYICVISEIHASF